MNRVEPKTNHSPQILRNIGGILFFLFTFGTVAIFPQNYDEVITNIETKRTELASIYSSANNKDSLLSAAQEFLFDKIVNEIFPAWYNTKWDFNGTTTIPQKGKIACGYFVTTILEHAGFKLPRVKWAQLASEAIILKLNKDVKKFRNRPVKEVIDYISTSGKGLYIVGLDIHVGFIVNDGEEISFVHSNYYKPEIGVMKESLEGNNPLADSKYRVIGKILHKTMVEKWITDVWLD
ncbi:MAG TPA: hypothetical protein PK397_00125 [Ignavibacteriaceae bacterium]|mgnify:CR=1 FL=1|nr:hypothetical protein [Ignavibacteriaceae bacterium]